MPNSCAIRALHSSRAQLAGGATSAAPLALGLLPVEPIRSASSVGGSSGRFEVITASELESIWSESKRIAYTGSIIQVNRAKWSGRNSLIDR